MARKTAPRVAPSSARAKKPARARSSRSSSAKPAAEEKAQTIEAQAGKTAEPRIVAIGASAGGLEALELFFDAMGADSGAAFVVIQHLSPDFPSVMDELLARHTSMRIRAAKAGLVVEPNVIYLRPAQQTLIIRDGVLLLTREDTKSHLNFPIDAFLKSLALDQRDKAIAVVLSGTGTDGTLGAAAIRDAGGVVLAQEPSSARFDSMPRALIERNLANASAPPRLLPRYVERVLNAQSLPTAEETADEPSSINPERRILQLLQRRCGSDFGYYKKSTVGRRIRRRAEMAHINDLATYVVKLEREPDEIDRLSKDLLIGVTAFFRDPEAFSVLSDKVLPKVMASMTSRRQVRVWVPGCATGEEAYSIAILLSEYARNHHLDLNVKIFATDIYRPALEKAGRGVYDTTAVRAALNADLAERYFEVNGEVSQVRPHLRRLVVFSAHNLLKDPPFTRMDLVSCRNLLIYFDEVAQRMALMLFHFSLDRNGFLFLGPSETVSELSDEFGVIDQYWRIFRKVRDVRLRESLRVLPSASMRGEAGPVEHEEHPSSPAFRTTIATRTAPVRRGLAKAYDAILDRYAPASVLVSREGTILHVFGDAHKYMTFKEGRFSPQITTAAVEELRHTISTGLERMRGRNTAPFARRVQCRLGREVEKIFKVTVERLDGADWQDESFCLVTFAELTEAKRGGSAGKEKIESVGKIELYQERIRDLENELRVTEESLQTTIEEMETTNEELQATNEELMSANEELQSTNEELNSVNEELLTVSAEHQRKIDELVEVTMDMNHLLKSTDIGVLYLDRDLRVRRLTSAIAKTFNLLEQDIGRPIEHITARFHQPGLLEDIREVLRGAAPCEHEIKVGEQVFLLRILPYQFGGEVAGVVLTIIEITARKHAENRLRTIVQTAVDAIVVIDDTGIIQSFNPSAERIFGYSNEEAIGQNVSILMSEPEKSAHDDYIQTYLRTGVGKVINTGREVEGRKKDGTIIQVDLALTEWSLEGRRYFTGIMRDISARKEREQHIRLIMRELSHRTKNVLAVVQAMAWQTARTTDDAHEFKERLSQRVEGLSRSIDLLVRHQWEGVTIEELVRDQLAPFLDEACNRLELNGPLLILEPNGAQDLGLVLHELATNASKYGALSAPTGRIIVGWGIANGGDNAEPMFHMRWNEEGGPPVEPPKQTGFGGTVIRDVMAKTHRATIDVDFAPEGLAWRLEVEAQRIIRPHPHFSEGEVEG
ncbi:MAG: CheR family methyltransferase [Xanthobacteraceae bacterium]